MKLTLDQVKMITAGALEIEERDDEFVFYRFEKEARDHYSSQTPSLNAKAQASASIRLDFLTDSDSFDADFSVTYGSSRTYYYFDICIDGIIRKHRVTRWLPNLATTRLSNIELADGATIKPIEYKRKFLCFGDSITHGYDAAFPSKSYVNRITSHFEAYTVNQAIGGERFVPEILLENTEYDPDVVTVAYGTNDWSGTKKEYFHPRCEEFFKKASLIYPRALRFAILPIWRADAKSGKQKYEGSLDEACNFIAETASKYGFKIIDARPFMPQSPEFFWDGRLHPNDLGFADYAAGVIKEIEKYL